MAACNDRENQEKSKVREKSKRREKAREERKVREGIYTKKNEPKRWIGKINRETIAMLKVIRDAVKELYLTDHLIS